MDDFHRRLGKVMWDKCGMARNAQGLQEAIAEIRRIREEFWKDVRVTGKANEFNQGGEAVIARRDLGGVLVDVAFGGDHLAIRLLGHLDAVVGFFGHGHGFRAGFRSVRLEGRVNRLGGGVGLGGDRWVNRLR